MAGRIVKLADAPKGKRVIVGGGRTYAAPKKFYQNEVERREDMKRVEAEEKLLFRVLDELAPIEIAQGEAPGADRAARKWAESRGVPCAKYRALWETEGVSAGPKRNRRMFAGFSPDGTITFPGGRGTNDLENVTLDGGAWLVRIRGIS